MAYKRLGEVLLANGTITDEELQRALELQKGTKSRLGNVLIDNKIITEEELLNALQMQLGLDYVDLTKVRIPVEMAQLVPKNMAKQYQVIPVRMSRDNLYLAMSDPLNFYAIEDVRKATHKKVIPVVSTASAIEHAIQTLYSNEGAARAIEEMKREAAGSGEVTEANDSIFSGSQIDEDINNAPTVRLVNSIIERAINEHASDIHIEPHEEELQVRMRIDGMMRDILSIPHDLQNSVISRIKVTSGLDIAEKRIPQDGRFNVRMKDADIDLRVSTLPTVYGEKVVARLLDKSGGKKTPQSVGLTGLDYEKYKMMIRISSGMILIVGPTGSGKSTTMSCIINDLNTREVNLVSLEDPVEYNIEGVNQVQINEKAGMTFASGLRAILRQDPDIISVGEIRDGETAEIAMRAAITGHIVISTIHTNDAVGTIERLQNIGVASYMIAGALKGVISQRLVRRICPKCKTPYKPDYEEKRMPGVPENEDVTFYRGAGCPECFNAGYRGRIAVFEMLPINSKVRTLIDHNGTRAEIEKELKSEDSDYVSLHDNALRLVKEGITTSSEMLRVTNDEL